MIGIEINDSQVIWSVIGWSLFAGILLGGIFYGGLWWTVTQRLAHPRAALWFVGGFIARMAIALGGIYWIAAGDWKKLAACMLGFFIGRLLVNGYSTRMKNTANLAQIDSPLASAQNSKDKTYAS